MSEDVSVTREMAAPADTVWAMVSDVTRMGEWSPENQGGTWLGGATGPQPGAKFRSANRVGKRKWKTVATGVSDRATHNRAGMEQTLERLAAAAEAPASGSTPG
ncbi:MAG: SRPBCC family protein [Acidimicrobiia bacterium]